MSNTGFALVDNVRIDTFEQFINIGSCTQITVSKALYARPENDNSGLNFNYIIQLKEVS
jgi:hypothetical protein